MKPRKLYADWYKNHLKPLLDRERKDPDSQYMFDRTFKSRDNLKAFYNKRGIKPKCKYSALARKLMKDVHIELKPFTNTNQRQHTTHNTVLRDFSCTVVLNDVPCTILCMGKTPEQNRTIMVLDCKDSEGEQYKDKIAYHAARQFFSRNTNVQDQVKLINDIISPMNYESEEDIFMLSTVTPYPEVLLKMQIITEALNNNPTLMGLYTVLRKLENK